MLSSAHSRSNIQTLQRWKIRRNTKPKVERRKNQSQVAAELTFGAGRRPADVLWQWVWPTIAFACYQQTQKIIHDIHQHNCYFFVGCAVFSSFLFFMKNRRLENRISFALSPEKQPQQSKSTPMTRFHLFCWPQWIPCLYTFLVMHQAFRSQKADCIVAWNRKETVLLWPGMEPLLRS